VRCSIVIPVHNRASLTRQCLETILADQGVRSNAEVMVVDDGSTDDTPQVLAGFGEAIRVVSHRAPAGFATACNRGAAEAAGEELVFLNNDTIPVAGWLEAILKYADEHPEAAVVGTKLLFPNDTIQHAGMVITDDLNPRHVYAGFPADHPAVNESRPVVAVTAACALFRRRLFEEAGGFDEAFRNGFEDVDLCLRLVEGGHEIHFCHKSVAYHLEMGTRDFSHEHENLELYRRRWAHRVRPDAIPRYLEDGLMRIDYTIRYPFSLHVSPLLGVVGGGERAANALLAARAKENAELLRENIQLRLLLSEAGIELPQIQLSPPRAEKPATARAALFVSGDYGDSMRYRGDYQAEQLELLGASAESHWLHDVPFGELVEAYGCFVLQRVPMDEHVAAFVEEAHRHGKIVICDVDELVFEPPAPDHARHAETIAAADAVFAATEPLAAKARRYNYSVFSIPNAAGREMIEVADETRAGRSDDGSIRLGYVAASPAASNFEVAADAVLWALETNASVRFVLIGELELDPRFDRYADRVERVPTQPWRRLLGRLAGLDVNLAPYDISPHAETTTCNSWLEAALVAIPTIASPRPDLMRVIDPRRNGLLAEADSDWLMALGELISSPERRRQLGSEAYADARNLHSTEARSQVLYEAISEAAGAAVRDRKLTINWLVGTQNGRQARKVARVADEFGRRGHRVRVFAESVPLIARPSVKVRALTNGPLPPADVALAADAVSTARLGGDTNALFRFALTPEAPPPFRRLPVDDPLETEVLERVLLELCFARLDPLTDEEGDA
jgi:GT2 family glycosyltransferase